MEASLLYMQAQESSVQQVQQGRAGIYVLANDKVAEFLHSSLQSIRHYNAAIPIWIIPFDERLDRTRELATRFSAQIVEHPSLPHLDQLGNQFWDNSAYANHMFRKFVAFWGPLETFLYFDVDIAALSDLASMFQVFDRANCDFLSFDNDMNRVYNPGAFREKMIKEYNSEGFNAGHFMARRGLFDFDQIRQMAVAGKPERDGFEDKIDQSFWNYIIDVSRVSHRRLPKVDPAYADKQWGDQTPILEMDGAYRLGVPGHGDYGKLVPFIHWSGHQQYDPFPNRNIFYRFRLSDLSKAQAAKYIFSDHYRWKTAPLRHAWNWTNQKLKRVTQRLSAGDLSRPRWLS
jgi:hypothetical protein